VPKSKSSVLCSPWLCSLTLLMLLLTLAAMGQQASVVPTLVNFKGTLTDINGKPLTGTVGVTFYLYKDSEGGAPLWMETQNVQPDKSGRYTVSLGTTTSTGLPIDVFVSGEARWLGVQPEGQAEQPRVLLLSVPYALKAGDAETIGGLPASAFVLANSARGNDANAKTTTAASSSTAAKNAAPPANPAVTGKGVVDYIPMWDTTSDIVDSVIFQKTSAIGIATTAPAATLDVNGKTDVRDTLTLFPKGTDSTLAISGTTFKVDQTGKVTFISGQTFPGTGTITGITTASGSGLSGGGTTGTLSLKVPAAGITNAMLHNSNITLNANTAGGLTTPGAMTLGSTHTMGLKPCAANQVLQYSGAVWNCASVGAGTITGVTAGTDLTGGGTSGVVTLNVDTTKMPQLSANNTFTTGQSITSYGNFDGLDSSAEAAGFNGVTGISYATTGSGYGVVGAGAGGGVSGFSISYNGPGGYFTGFSGPSGSGTGGSEGVIAIGGNSGDIGGTGGVGIYAVGGSSGISVGGDGGEFVGGNGLAYGAPGVVGTGGGGLNISDGPGGRFQGGNSNCCGDGIDAYVGSIGGYAAYFTGDVSVTGALSAGTKDFKIDHPLDPANKYLVHASVESSEMMNIYTGNVTTDAQGEATVQLPGWFETLNTDFRYQLTVIGQFAQAIIAHKIGNNQFTIRTNAPNVEVSWQVTGVRQDAFAKAHPLVVEEEKDARMKGFYIHPDLYGAPEEKQIEWARHPEMMKQMKERREAPAANRSSPRAPVLPLRASPAVGPAK